MKKDNETLPEAGVMFFERAKELCEKEGAKGWKLVQNTMLKEEARNQRLNEAINYIMLKYQPDYFRSAFVSFCCKAVGGNSETAIPMGASLTLFAWAIGIHDDIIDQTRTKNKHPTVLGKFGKDLALILSDVLLFKGFTLFRNTLKSEISVERLTEILEIVEKIWFEQSVGEAFEIQTRRSIDVTPKECLAKIHMRASEMEACARIGGILGSGTEKQLDCLGRFGRLIGMMGILRNEIIDMLEPEVLNCRILRESLPLPVVFALQNQTVKSQLVSLLMQNRLKKEELKVISRYSNLSGGLDYVANYIKKMSEEAFMCVEKLKEKNLKTLARAFLLRPDEWKTLLED